MAKLFDLKNGFLKDLLVIVLLSLICTAAFWDMAILKKTLLRGDYLTQFYPWLSYYSDSLKAFRIPWWITNIQCGFPLAAEGQIGAFYPLNIVFFFLLPFKAAYNYSFLFHFVMAGVFTYYYAKGIAGSRYGSFLAACVFCFGSSYAGAFVNIAVLRVIAFFPLALILADKYFLDKNGIRLGVLLGIVWGVQLLAGSPQMAVYAIGFSALYFCVNVLARKKDAKKAAFFIFSAAITALLLYLPQLLPSLEIARASNRPTFNVDFAMWNSFSPLALSGLLNPRLGMMFVKDNVVFIGIIGLLFAFIGLTRIRTDKNVRVSLLFCILALCFALGKYNPAYYLFIKAMNLSFFRCPSRWVVFVDFFGAIIAAIGVKYFMEMSAKDVRRVLGAFIRSLLITFVLLILAGSLMTLFESGIKSLFREHVEKNIIGSQYHRYTLDYYLGKIDMSFSGAHAGLAFSSLLVILWAAGLLFYRALARYAGKVLKAALVLAIVPELLFMGSLMKGPFYNIDDFSKVENVDSVILRHLKADTEAFRILPFGGQKDLPAWVYYNTNGLFDIDSVGVYTPLVNREYFLLMSGLGAAEDALGVLPPKEDAISGKIDILRRMNVKYIVSSMKLGDVFLSELENEGNLYLYQVEGCLPRVRFSRTADSRDMVKTEIKILKYRPGHLEAELDAASDGYLIFAERRDRHWKAGVNGASSAIYPADNIFQAVKIVKGKAKVIWEYGQELF